MGAAHPFGIGLAEGWGVGWGQWRGRGSAFRGGDRASCGCLMASGVRAYLWLRDAVVTNGITRRWSRPLAVLASAQRQVRRQGDILTVKRMDNVGIVVEDIDAAIEFFTELGLELEGRAPIEG